MAQWLSYPTFTGPFTGQEQFLVASSASPGGGMVRVPWYAVANFTGSNLFLPLAGGTMIGPLVLAADPTANLGAATKQYVDNNIISGGPFLRLAGGTMLGSLVLSGDPTTNLEAATKQYVDSSIGGPFLALAGGTMTGEIVSTIPADTSGLFISRTDGTGTHGTPTAKFQYTGGGGSNGIVFVTGTQVDGNSHMWGLNASLNLTKIGTGAPIALAGSVFRRNDPISGPGSPGGSTAFALYAQVHDHTGLGGSNDIAFECDVLANGPEGGSSTYWAPYSGQRVSMLLNLGAETYPDWAAGATYAVGDVVNPSGSSTYTYIVTIGGVSGSSPPVWPTSAGTVTDGGVTWTFGTTLRPQISRGLSIGGYSGHPYAADVACPLLIAFVSVYDALIDMSLQVTKATALNANVAAIRMAPDWPIDFSGGAFNTQNLRTLQYTSGNTALEYQANGTVVLSVADGLDCILGRLSTTGQIMKFGLDIGTNAALVLNGKTASTRYVEFDTASSPRWRLSTNNTAESGSNVGSDFQLQAYADAGTFLRNAITVSRSTGVATLAAATVGLGTAAANFALNGAVGAARNIQFQSAGSLRWELLANTTAEGGANAGSDLQLDAYSDTAVFVGTAMQGDRATAQMVFPHGIQVGGLVGASNPVVLAGAGVPSSTQPMNSLFMRNDGTAGVYVSQGGGSWTQLTVP